MSGLRGFRLVCGKPATHQGRQVRFVLRITICSLIREMGILLALNSPAVRDLCAPG